MRLGGFDWAGVHRGGSGDQTNVSEILVFRIAFFHVGI